MELKTQKRKRYLILLLICLALSAATAGVYLFANNETSLPYTLDKYTDVVDWCEPNTENSELKINCKALLISIKNQEDNSTCFNAQVITNAKELKDITICEKGDTLTYTNDVLAYKVLMPIDITFTYTQGLLNHFSFKNVSFTKLDDTYIQSIVNEDIANLVTLDPSSTTIQNSVDFCPKPDTLPSYVTEENKTKYTEFFSKNILTEKEYTNGYLYNLDDSTIRMLFACKSTSNLGYKKICNSSKINGLKLLPNVITQLNVHKIQNNNLDSMLVKRISLTYDTMHFINPPINMASLEYINELITSVNSENSLSETSFCGFYDVMDELAKIDDRFEYNKNYILNYLLDNIQTISSPSCVSILSNNITYVDKKGLFLKANDSTDIEDICNNLSMFVNEDK